MPVVVACPKCKKKYSLKENMLGRAVKCTQCAATFKTPAPGSGRTQQRAARVQSPEDAKAQLAAQAAAKARASEMTKLGIDGPIRKEPDIFAEAVAKRPGEMDPLANHVVQDPGFGQIDRPAVEEEQQEENELAQMLVNPALEPIDEPKSKMRAAKSRGKQSSGLLRQFWFLILIVFIPLFILTAVLTFVSPGLSLTLTFVGLGILGLISTALTVWAMIKVYETTPAALQIVLCLLVPFYIIYYIIVHWDSMKPVAYAFLAQTLVTMIGVGALVLAAGNAVVEQGTAGM